ncbi:Gag protein [Phytophthora palmivora]|uniref:Gag protein n=1 Tax=Phytophthora palmivora TaxID=4796 RepID=A0A2P4XA44_9STRA|nr:Gag protein [Phytophthora palmivora]
MKPAQPKLSLKSTLNYEEKEGENLHFWVREVELAMETARPSDFESLSPCRAKTWAYTREATTPGCFTTWAQLCQHLRAAFLPANYEYRYEEKEGENLHFWVREVELAMETALISTKRLRVAFSLSNLGGRAKT